MDILIILGFLGIILILLALLKRYRSLYLEEKFKKGSIAVKHGKMIEQFIPWIKEVFPYDPEKFRFIGDPIDGILFDDEEIVFIEFKTGDAKLNKRQKTIKNLVKNKKIKWKEIRIS